MSSKTTWMVRCEGGDLYEVFVERGVIALGDREPQGDLSEASNRDDLRRLLLASRHPRFMRSPGYTVGVLNNFVCEMKPGDRVITYYPSRRVYRAGEISGPYRHDPAVINGKQHLRNVRWDVGEFSRDDLSEAGQRSLSPQASAFRVANETAQEIDNLLHAQRT